MQKPMSNKKNFISLLKDFTQNLEAKNVLEHNLEEPSFKLLNQMSEKQIQLYIQQAKKKNYELIIQTNPTAQYQVYREITGFVSAHGIKNKRILVENRENNIVFVIPLGTIRFIRRREDR